MTVLDTPVVTRLSAKGLGGVTLARQSPDVHGAMHTLHTLHPGDVAVGSAGDRMTTLLGSCVAIVLTDPRRTVGAMCHIVHAHAASSAQRTSGAFADAAFAALFDLLLARGITPHLCQAYVYGGGNMFPGLDIEPGCAVGDDNAHWALDALDAEGIRVLHHDLGGPVYRRICWTVGPAAPVVVSVSI